MTFSSVAFHHGSSLRWLNHHRVKGSHCSTDPATLWSPGTRRSRQTRQIWQQTIWTTTTPSPMQWSQNDSKASTAMDWPVQNHYQMIFCYKMIINSYEKSTKSIVVTFRDMITRPWKFSSVSRLRLKKKKQTNKPTYYKKHTKYPHCICFSLASWMSSGWSMAYQDFWLTYSLV